jgi:hypothetical protein
MDIWEGRDVKVVLYCRVNSCYKRSCNTMLGAGDVILDLNFSAILRVDCFMP